MAGEFSTFLDEALSLADDYVKSGGIRVSLKTNYGPEFTVGTSSLVSDGSSSSSG